ncbi:MAG TPA: hypothetical protein VF535_07010 [Allosphingosinicella sp.]|jgi:hypothetical protein
MADGTDSATVSSRIARPLYRAFVDPEAPVAGLPPHRGAGGAGLEPWQGGTAASICTADMRLLIIILT